MNNENLFNQGMEYFNEGKNSKALEIFSNLANSGHVEAQNHLAFMYEEGKGVDVDYLMAEKYYLKSAEGGNSAAQFNLSLMYLNGLGVEKDIKKAHKWLEAAAKQGVPQAQLNLAILIIKTENRLNMGMGSLRYAYTWACTALEQGFEPAKSIVEMMRHMEAGHDHTEWRKIVGVPEVKN